MVSPATTFTFTLTATHRMVDRVHGHATDVRTPAQPATASGLAAGNVHMVNVPDLSDCRVGILMDSANLSRRQTHKGVTTLTVAQNRLLTGASSHLTAPPRNNLNVVNGCP